MEFLRGRCQIVTGVFVAIMLVSAIAALQDVALLQYLQGIAAGAPVDLARAEGIDTQQGLLGLLQLVLFIACAVAFLMWFHRAHKNLAAGGLTDLEHTPGWAVGGFFVPILNLVRPYQVMKEVWAGSAFLSQDYPAESWKAVPSSPLVGWWWGLFLVSSWLGNASGRMMMAEEPAELLVSGWVTLASDLMDLPSALLAMLLVRQITDFQEKARVRLRASEPYPGM